MPAKKTTDAATAEVKEEEKTVAKKTTAKKTTTAKKAETTVEAPATEVKEVKEVKAEKKTAPKAKKVSAKKVDYKFPKATVQQFDTIIGPVITEKTMAQMQNLNQVTVKVAPKANRAEIKLAFEAVFGVKVENVNIVNTLAKYKKVGRFAGTTPAFKKAIVKLADGQALDLFKE